MDQPGNCQYRSYFLKLLIVTYLSAVRSSKRSPCTTSSPPEEGTLCPRGIVDSSSVALPLQRASQYWYCHCGWTWMTAVTCTVDQRTFFAADLAKGWPTTVEQRCTPAAGPATRHFPSASRLRSARGTRGTGGEADSGRAATKGSVPVCCLRSCPGRVLVLCVWIGKCCSHSIGREGDDARTSQRVARRREPLSCSSLTEVTSPLPSLLAILHPFLRPSPSQPLSPAHHLDIIVPQARHQKTHKYINDHPPSTSDPLAQKDKQGFSSPSLLPRRYKTLITYAEGDHDHPHEDCKHLLT